MILGGGFAGLYAAKALRRAPVRITLVDRQNHHLFQPMLYQVATAALNPADIASPIRSILRRQPNVEVLLGEVVGSRRAEPARSRWPTAAALATTTCSSPPERGTRYFGHDDWEALAPGLKSLEDALEIRRRVLLAFERAEREPDPVKRHALLTFVVVGGGPTGVEVAGALAEIRRYRSAARLPAHRSPRGHRDAAGGRTPHSLELSRVAQRGPSATCARSASRCAPRPS